MSKSLKICFFIFFCSFLMSCKKEPEPEEYIDPRCSPERCSLENLKTLRKHFIPEKNEYPYRMALYANPLTESEWEEWRIKRRIKELKYVLIGILTVDYDRNIHYQPEKNIQIPKGNLEYINYNINNLISSAKGKTESVFFYPLFSAPKYSDYFIPALRIILTVTCNLEVLHLPSGFLDKEIPEAVFPRSPRH